MKNTFEKQVNNLSFNEESDSEWKKTKVERMNKYQIIRNNFITLLIFNVIDLLGFSFACLFYKWFKIRYTTKDYSEYMWVNFLYIRYNDEVAFMNQNYDSVYKKFCLNFEKNDYSDCETGFKLLKNIGIACFSFILFGFILHFLEIIRLVFILRGKRNKMCLKAFFLHPLILTSLSLPILLYIFMIIYLNYIQENGHFSFGASFYVAAVMFTFYFIVLIYYRQQKKRLEVHETMDKLLIELNRTIDVPGAGNQSNNVISSSNIKEFNQQQNKPSNENINNQNDINDDQDSQRTKNSTFVL